MKMLNVYLTNLAKYNEGYLMGEWLELPLTEEELADAIKRVAPNGEDELFITDFESDLGIEVGEYENVNVLNNAIAKLEEVASDEYDQKKLAAIIEENGVDLYKVDELIDKMDDYEFYQDWDGAEYEEHIFNECYPDCRLENAGWFKNFITIDFDAAARDDDIFEATTGVLVRH